MRFRVLILTGFLCISCAGKSPDSSIDKIVSQQSVVQTTVDNSMLYRGFNQWRKEGPVIPGLLQALVPQGMAYWEEKDLMVISNYMNDNTAGVLTILKMDSGSLEKVVFLYNHDGTPHRGHVGGLALSSQYLWIASDSGVYYISLKELISTEDQGEIYLPKMVNTETKASFATISHNILWIGEFTLKNGSYPVSKTHLMVTPMGSEQRGWLGGYILDDETDMIDREDKLSGKVNPDFILSIPDKIQGALFFENKILLSESYGRKNYSRLLIYNNPLSEISHKRGDKSLWFLDGSNKTNEIITPPMSEALVLYKESIALLFESAALKYRDTALYPLENLQFLSTEAFKE